MVFSGQTRQISILRELAVLLAACGTLLDEQHLVPLDWHEPNTSSHTCTPLPVVLSGIDSIAYSAPRLWDIVPIMKGTESNPGWLFSRGISRKSIRIDSDTDRKQWGNEGIYPGRKYYQGATKLR
jgi:hypothetical protein